MSNASAESTTGRNMLLTSAGPTTEVMRGHMLDFARQARVGERIRVLRLADGWAPFGAEDRVPRGARLAQRAESFAARLWSNRYLAYVFGSSAVVTTVRLSEVNSSEAATLLEGADVVLVPGGNTYQARRGIGSNAAILRQAVRRGLPYIGDSAGSILAGSTLDPAALAPADTRPQHMGQYEGLGLIGADIVVHAAGDHAGFDIPGMQAWLAQPVFRANQTTEAVVRAFAAGRAASGLEVYTLHDARAVLVQDGQVSYV